MAVRPDLHSPFPLSSADGGEGNLSVGGVYPGWRAEALTPGYKYFIPTGFRMSAVREGGRGRSSLVPGYYLAPLRLTGFGAGIANRGGQRSSRFELRDV